MHDKIYLDIDVYQAARQRMEAVFDDFMHVYLAFSAGKDSGVMLNLALDVARAKGRLPLDVMIVDLEAQYQHTVDYIQRVANNPDVRLYWICLPIQMRNGVSQFQPHWTCWHPDQRDIWTRELPTHPSVIADESFFPFFKREMKFDTFVQGFGEWFSAQRGHEPCACLIAIRSAESLNRHRTIVTEDKTRWKDYPWTTQASERIYKVYPIYDWTADDIWIANGKFGWDYNKTYDLMYLAGVPKHKMRLCQPYGNDQRQGLWLFKILEPDTWSKVVNRVQGANFGNRHALDAGNMMGNVRITLPHGHSWKSYTKLLLASSPPDLAQHYRCEIVKSLKRWKKDVRNKQNSGCKHKADWSQAAKVILSYDYHCKGLNFVEADRAKTRTLNLIQKYKDI